MMIGWQRLTKTASLAGMTISNSRGTPMSYTTEHKRIKPVLDLARKLDYCYQFRP